MSDTCYPFTGLFTATRWVQNPPSEETRLLALAVEALHRRAIDPAGAVVMLRSYANAVLVVAPDGLTTSDVTLIEQFAETERFDVVAAPGLDPATTNLFNVLPDEQYSALAAALIESPDLEPVYNGHDFQISCVAAANPDLHDEILAALDRGIERLREVRRA